MLDLYSQSLLFTKNVLKVKFNITSEHINNKVPAHIPHLIHTDTVKKLQEKLREEIGVTSMNRFRSRNDIQFGYSYFTYLMLNEGRKDFITDEELVQFVFFEMIDTNKNGCVDSLSEQRTLAAIILAQDESFIKFPTIQLFEFDEDFEELSEFSHRLTESIITRVISRIKRDANKSNSLAFNVIDSLLTNNNNCLNVPMLMKSKRANLALLKSGREYIARVKPTVRVMDNTEDYSAFVMLKSNATYVQLKLDKLRGRRTKFVCINDDLDGSQSEENEKVSKVLVDFYHSLFPVPSGFERKSEKAGAKTTPPLRDVVQNRKEEEEDMRFVFYFEMVVLSILVILVLLFALAFLRRIKRRNNKMI